MAVPAPTPSAWTAPEGWHAIEFLSDLHLCADTPRGLEALAAHLRHTDADAVVLLGDVFEFWVGDDQRSQPFELHCVGMLAEAARRLDLGFMPGNRDFLAGPALQQAIGWRTLADPTLLQAWGRRVLLTHGDALCLADTAYQRFRTLSRGPAWQRDFLAQPLAQRLHQAALARAESEARKRATGVDPALWADVDRPAALSWLQATGADTLVHGHTHRPATERLAPGVTRHVLTDWDLDHAGTAPRAGVLRLTRDGFARRPPATAP